MLNKLHKIHPSYFAVRKTKPVYSYSFLSFQVSIDLKLLSASQAPKKLSLSSNPESPAACHPNASMPQSCSTAKGCLLPDIRLSSWELLYLLEIQEKNQHFELEDPPTALKQDFTHALNNLTSGYSYSCALLMNMVSVIDLTNFHGYLAFLLIER